VCEVNEKQVRERCCVQRVHDIKRERERERERERKQRRKKKGEKKEVDPMLYFFFVEPKNDVM